MRNISQLVASLMLLGTQANVTINGGTADAQSSSTTNASALEVRLNTNTADAIEIAGPKTPDYNTEVLAPLQAAQAAAAAKAAAQKAAKAAASRKVHLTVPTPGSHTDWMAAAGIAPADYGYVDYIVSHESGWVATKSNYAGSGAYGLGQALPASKMAKFGSDYMTNPVTQLRWATAYAVGRYGSWANAYAHWIAHRNW